MTDLLSDEQIEEIVRAAGAAPSMHNTQPWQFCVAADGSLELYGDPGRTLWVADPQGRALYLGCGAALFNARLAIRMTGHEPLVRPLPHPEHPPTLLAIVARGRGTQPTAAERELYDAIWRRHTNRRPFTGQAVPKPVQVAMEQAARAEAASLRMLSRPDAETVLNLSERARRRLADDRGYQDELRRWVATGSREDGIPASALPLRPDREPAPVRDYAVSAAVGAERPAATYERYPQLAVLSTERDEPADWLRAGEALQRLLLTATVNGVSASFLFEPIELMDMLDMDPRPWPWPEHPQMIIRFGYGPPVPATPRRKLEDVLRRGQYAQSEGTAELASELLAA
ncbi:MAG: Acg family FMN-binding oxidoreductase [Streptosporangiaceae bacterium]